MGCGRRYLAGRGRQRSPESWHGNIVTVQGMKTDVLPLGTMGMIVADMTADHPGTWSFHRHIEPHRVGGMAT
jgi:FtsP/CotA-like multicopper oxidase with cupredoxin domain